MKRKYLIFILLGLIVAGVFVKIKYPYINAEFLKNSFFPPGSVVDARTQATAVIYTKKLTVSEIFRMIKGADSVMVISTINPDGSPHAGVLKVSENKGRIEILGLPGDLTCENLEKTQKALITIYQRPVKGKKWFENIGARLWVKLIDKHTKSPAEVNYLVEIEHFRAI